MRTDAEWPLSHFRRADDVDGGAAAAGDGRDVDASESLRCTRTENLALTMIVRDGIAAIWELHLAAANAYNQGYKAAAAAIIDIADAAECLRGNGCA
jgi:hypothetical protein